MKQGFLSRACRQTMHLRQRILRVFCAPQFKLTVFTIAHRRGEKILHRRPCTSAFGQPESIKNGQIGWSDSGDSSSQVADDASSHGTMTRRAHQIFSCTAPRGTNLGKLLCTAEPELARQSPSLRLRMSLTACGLALPPDDFITWPTNHPIAFGLVFASATLSGLPGDDFVDDFLDRAECR